MKSYLIYKIYHPQSEWCYIGKTYNLQQRKSKHLSDSRIRPKTFLHYWLRKYPESIFEILEDNLNEEQSLIREKEWIELYKDEGIPLMNLTLGGEGVSGYNHTEETKQIISEAHKNLSYSETSRKIMSDKKLGEKHWLFGKKYSHEHKLNSSISHTTIHRPVNVYDMDGNLLGEYGSPSEVKQYVLKDEKGSTGDILCNCRRKQMTCHGYIFQFKDDDRIEEILENYKKQKVHNTKEILQYDINNNLLNIYKNSYQAEKLIREQGVKISSTDIRKCCEGKSKTVKGFIFKYGNPTERKISKKIEPKTTPQIKVDELTTEIIEHNNQEEPELLDYIKSIYKGEIQTNATNIINYDTVDIFLPELKIAIDYNRLNLSSEQSGKRKYYRLNKLNKCNEKGIRLVSIFSDEWGLKNEIVKLKLNSIINKTKGSRIYARKCEIKEIDHKIKNDFLNKYHIQGEDRSNIKLGIFHMNELVGVCTFSKPRIHMNGNSEKKGIYELSRFASSCYIVGGLNKCLSYFIRTYSPEEIYSYSDNRWTDINDNMYLKSGFIKTGKSVPNYFYTKDYINRIHRFTFCKVKLKERGFDTSSKTEDQITKEIGLHKIWDCGATKYRYNISF